MAAAIFSDHPSASGICRSINYLLISWFGCDSKPQRHKKKEVISMPGKDGKGPIGQGPQDGHGEGKGPKGHGPRDGHGGGKGKGISNPAGSKKGGEKGEC